MNMAIPKIIVEGGNLSGKSSIVEALEKEYVHSVVTTLHGYYHPDFISQTADAAAAVDYHRRRLHSFLPAFKNISAEPLIFNRYQLTASVYLKLFYNIEESFHDVEEELNDLGAYFVLADFNDDAIRERILTRRETGKEAPFGDDNLSKITEKRDLYRYFFEKSKLKNKYLVDNSTNLPETIKYIRNLVADQE